MTNIKNYLKQIGYSKQLFAEEIRISRPTLDAYIDAFENNRVIGKERYQIIFNHLFGGDVLEGDEFRKRINEIKNLFERDERLGVEELDVGAADTISEIKELMRNDMKNDWDKKAYDFIKMFILSYHANSILKKLAEYFVFLNQSNINDLPTEDQKPYFANFYKTFSQMIEGHFEYKEEDYERFNKRRIEICEKRNADKKAQEDKLNKLISQTIDELTSLGEAPSDEKILKAVLSKMNGDEV